MIFRFVSQHLPPWATALVCGLVYSSLILLVWYRWSAPSAPFRYIGL